MAFTDNKAQHDTSKDDKKQAEVYLNPGIEMTNPVTGEVQFVSLPWGVPVDTQTFTVKNTNDEAYNAMQIMKKKLLDGIQSRAADMDPEEEIVIPMQLVMRRRKAQISEREVNDATVTQLDDFLAILNGTDETEEVTEEKKDPIDQLFAKAG